MLRYYQHFGLQRDPFLDTSDPQFYLELPAVRRNLRRVITGIEESRGLTVVVGVPGSGKTSLSASVEQVLLADEETVVGKILDPSFASELEFLLGIGRVFGLTFKTSSTATLKNAIKNYLFDVAVEQRGTLVLLIDEAQNITGECLEALRLLLNFQLPDRKLLNIVLFGQEELAQALQRRENLNDRVDTFVWIEPLDRSGSAALIEHRLTRAGKTPLVQIFTSDAMERMIAIGNGLPRRLTNIVRGAMIEAAERGAEIVRLEHVSLALRARGMRTVARPTPADTVSGEIEMTPAAPAAQPAQRTFVGRLLAWLP